MILEKDNNGNFFLKKATDEKKDQTYFLWTLNQDTLSKVLFPLGDYTKEEILTYYCNIISFEGTKNGVNYASKRFFNKDIKHVNLSVSTSDQMINGKYLGKKTKEEIILFNKINPNMVADSKKCYI